MRQISTAYAGSLLAELVDAQLGDVGAAPHQLRMCGDVGVAHAAHRDDAAAVRARAYRSVIMECEVCREAWTRASWPAQAMSRRDDVDLTPDARR